MQVPRLIFLGKVNEGLNFLPNFCLLDIIRIASARFVAKFTSVRKKKIKISVRRYISENLLKNTPSPPHIEQYFKDSSNNDFFWTAIKFLQSPFSFEVFFFSFIPKVPKEIDSLQSIKRMFTVKLSK